MAVRQVSALLVIIALGAQARALPPAYPKLALTLSMPYSTKELAGKDKPEVPAGIATDAAALQKAIAALPAGKHKMIASARASLDDGVKKSAASAEELKALVRSSEANLKEVQATAARGGYIREVDQYDSTSGRRLKVDDGQKNVRTAEFQYDRRKSQLLTRIAQSDDMIMGQARQNAWEAMLPYLDDIYPTDALPKGGLELVVNAATNSLSVKNKSGQKLSQVTVVVELLSGQSAPEPSCLKVYFLPTFEPEQSVWLVPQFGHNVKPRKYPLTGRESGISLLNLLPHDDALELIADLSRYSKLDSYVEIRHAAWSAEGRQTRKSVTFPERAAAAADETLDNLYQRLRGEDGRAPTEEGLAKLVKSPLWAFARQEAQRVGDYLPKSEAAARGKTLLENPVGYFQAEVKRTGIALDRMLKPGLIYVYEETKQPKLGEPAPKTPDLRKLAVVVEGRNPETNAVSVLVFDPADPNRWWRFAGGASRPQDKFQGVWINWPGDEAAGSPKAKLQPTTNPRSLSPFPRSPDQLTPSEKDIYRLTEGQASKTSVADITFGGDSLGRQRVLVCRLASGNALRQAYKASTAAADASDLAAVAELRRGLTYAGTWKAQAPAPVLRERTTAKLRLAGELKLRVENFRPETRELTVVVIADGSECRRPGTLACLPSGQVVIDVPVQVPEQPVERPFISPLRRKPVEIKPLATDFALRLRFDGTQLAGDYSPPDASSSLSVGLRFDLDSGKP